jgi:hypothetical protein
MYSLASRNAEISYFSCIPMHYAMLNNLMYSFENATNYQNTTSNALNGLHDDGEIGGTGDSWKQYWIGKRFFQSFLSGFTIAISARTQILPLALINLCIILIVAI